MDYSAHPLSIVIRLCDSRCYNSQMPTPPALLGDLEIRLLFAHFDDLPPGGWNHPSLMGDFWRLYQNYGEGGRLVTREAEIPLESGAVYLIPAGLTLASRNDAHFAQFFVHFDLTGIPPIALRELFPGPSLVPLPPQSCETVRELGRRISRLGYGDLATRCTVKGVIYEALGCSLAGLPGDALERCWLRVSALGPVLPALREMQERMEQRLGVPELAALCSMSEDHFIRRFREAVGLAPGRYLLKRRIAVAAQRLLFTSESIDQIAAQTGFGDRFYFSRVFRRETGSPPAAYRRGPRA